MVWCRAGLRGDFLSVYTDLFYEPQTFENLWNPHALYHVCVPCMSMSTPTESSGEIPKIQIYFWMTRTESGMFFFQRVHPVWIYSLFKSWSVMITYSTGCKSPDSRDRLLCAGVKPWSISKWQGCLGWPKDWRKPNGKSRYWRTGTGYEAMRPDKVTHHANVQNP